MRASTELILWEILSLADSLTRLSLRNFDESFEGWAYRNGVGRRVRRLEAEAYLERQPGGSADRIYRLTPKGRLAALGGRDPEAMWSRPWDGRWRIFTFDLPEKPRRPRMELWRFLRDEGFGCLQGSVWISPDPFDKVRARLKGLRHVASLALFNAESAGREKPSEIVAGAWNFVSINDVWEGYGSVLRMGPALFKATPVPGDEHRAWIKEEHAAWKRVLDIDPFLPSTLLPSGYRGRKLWKERTAAWAKIRNALKLRQVQKKR